MLAKVFSAAVFGVDAYDLDVEVSDNGGQKDAIVIVGLPDAAVREARDRVKTAISNSGFRWPGGHVTVNLAPADVKKEGPSFDLPIALSMIACAQERELPFAKAFPRSQVALGNALAGTIPLSVEETKPPQAVSAGGLRNAI